jgi:hypothetical protein
MQNPFAVSLAALGLLATVGLTAAVDTHHRLAHPRTYAMMGGRNAPHAGTQGK